MPRNVAEKNCHGLPCSNPKSTAETSTEVGTEYRLRKPCRMRPRKNSSSVNGATITSTMNDSQGTVSAEVRFLKNSSNHPGGGNARRNKLSTSDNRMHKPSIVMSIGSKSAPRTGVNGRISAGGVWVFFSPQERIKPKETKLTSPTKTGWCPMF